MSRSIGRAGARSRHPYIDRGASAGLATRGQSPQNPQQPVFRGGANFVNVDAYPRRDGRLVEGLTAADFQIFEDGKPQRIESFEFIKIEPNVPDADRRDPNTQRDAERLLNDPRRRAFVVYLDEYHISRWGSPRAAWSAPRVPPAGDRAVGSVRGHVAGHAAAEPGVRSAAGGRRTRARAVSAANDVRRRGCGCQNAADAARAMALQLLHPPHRQVSRSNEAFIARLIDLLHTDIVLVESRGVVGTAGRASQRADERAAVLERVAGRRPGRVDILDVGNAKARCRRSASPAADASRRARRSPTRRTGRNAMGRCCG